MPATAQTAVAVIGIDIGKNSFHVVGLDSRGAIVLRQKWSRGQVEARLANMSPCQIGMEACVGAHHLSRKLKALGHDARLMAITSLRYLAEDGAVASRDLLRHEAQPGGEVTAFGERISVADRGHHSAGDNRSDAGNALFGRFLPARSVRASSMGRAD